MNEGRAQVIAALLRMHPPHVVAKMLRDIDAGKSAAEVTLNAYRPSSTAPASAPEHAAGDSSKRAS